MLEPVQFHIKRDTSDTLIKDRERSYKASATERKRSRYIEGGNEHNEKIRAGESLKEFGPHLSLRTGS